MRDFFEILKLIVQLAMVFTMTTGGGGMTASERRRRETMLERDLAKAERGEIKSHRDKVKDFNSYLSSMTEHYDLPKVSKGN